MQPNPFIVVISRTPYVQFDRVTARGGGPDCHASLLGQELEKPAWGRLAQDELQTVFLSPRPSRHPEFLQIADNAAIFASIGGGNENEDQE
jgi:hypothetical protein